MRDSVMRVVGKTGWDIIQNVEPEKARIAGILSESGSFVFSGPSKSMKSWKICDLAYSLATGSPFLGRFKVNKTARVGVFCQEDGLPRLRRMIETVTRAKRLELEDITGSGFQEHFRQWILINRRQKFCAVDVDKLETVRNHKLWMTVGGSMNSGTYGVDIRENDWHVTVVPEGQIAGVKQEKAESEQSQVLAFVRDQEGLVTAGTIRESMSFGAAKVKKYLDQLQEDGEVTTGSVVVRGKAETGFMGVGDAA